MQQSPPAGTTARPLDHADWMAAAAAEYALLDDLLGLFSAEQWLLPTQCPGWAVRDMVAHLVGAAESTARVRETLRQAWRARSAPGAMLVDRVNAVQVAERADVPPARLRADLRDAGARGVRSRTRLPAALRRVPLPFGPPLGTRPLGYLTDRIYTRDAWMHRIDLSAATGLPLVLTPQHDGRLVADVVAEWADAHGQPFELTLTGPAGGTWTRPSGGPALTLDAVEFVRLAAGRGLADHPLLRQQVPF